MRTTIPVVLGTYINNDIRVFQSKTTAISLLCAATSSVMRLRASLVNNAEDWRWGSLWRWLQKPEPEPKLLSTWPIPRLPNWVGRVNQPLTQDELDAVQLSAQRGRPMGDDGWVEAIARRLNLESTMRPRGRQRVHPERQNDTKKT